MSYWHLLIISAAAIFVAVTLYVALRWSKAPRVFKAMGFVATASLTAGVLVGLWSMHMLDTWIGSEVSEAETTPGIRAGVPAASPASRVTFPESPPVIASATPATATSAASGILASYIGQALAQGLAKNTTAGSVETWPQIHQGCRLGNYEPRSALCRAATLAVRGWGDNHAIPVPEVAEFCDAGYLEEGLALCLAAQRRVGLPVDRTAAEGSPGGAVAGIPESDVVEAFGPDCWLGFKGPDGSMESQTKVLSLCTQQVYATASPACEAAFMIEHGRRNDTHVPYPEVASFCDVALIFRNSEVCRAAYRYSQPKSDPAR